MAHIITEQDECPKCGNFAYEGVCSDIHFCGYEENPQPHH